MQEPSGKPRTGGLESDGKASKDAELVALGLRVFRFRQRAGMTQETLAAAAGLHWTYVGQIERGERNLTYKNVLKLARGLQVSPSDLMP